MGRKPRKQITYRLIRFGIRCIFSVVPLQKKVVFSCFSGKCYADNPKYISRKLHELFPDYRQIWVKQPEYDFDVPDYVEVVELSTFSMVRELATSKVWVDSHLKLIWTPKRRKQYYIETWHGGIAFKKLEKDIEDQLDSAEIVTQQYNVGITDLMISNATFTTSMYRSAFWGYAGEIMECGYPRNDSFFENTDAVGEKIKQWYGISGDTHILLYAPTFRGLGNQEENTDMTLYEFDYSAAVRALEQSTGESWCFLLRLHPVLIHREQGLTFEDPKIINATDYDDMQELILASDLFVTDYSSGIIDFALLNRLGILYIPDLEEYLRDRGLYFNLQDLPFPMAQTEKDLLALLREIKTFDMQHYQDALQDFWEEIGMIRTNRASEAVCHRIHEVMES